jgi:hypothetical protein
MMELYHSIERERNVAKLVNFKYDFGIAAEWHFFATSLGKGPFYVVGSTAKRQASRTALHCPYIRKYWPSKCSMNLHKKTFAV